MNATKPLTLPTDPHQRAAAIALRDLYADLPRRDDIVSRPHGNCPMCRLVPVVGDALCEDCEEWLYGPCEATDGLTDEMIEAMGEGKVAA